MLPERQDFMTLISNGYSNLAFQAGGKNATE
jgi:hypothetical protein